MRDLIRTNSARAKAHLKLVRSPQTLDGSRTVLASVASVVPCVSPWVGTVVAAPSEGRLISSHDAVISRKLQEQTRVVLATLTPHEQWVLRLRFGITQIGDPPLEKIDEMLTPDQMAFIEATALRKLRHPSQGARLKSVDHR